MFFLTGLARGLARLLGNPGPNTRSPAAAVFVCKIALVTDLFSDSNSTGPECAGLSMSAMKTSSDFNSTNANAPAPPGGSPGAPARMLAQRLARRPRPEAPSGGPPGGSPVFWETLILR